MKLSTTFVLIAAAFTGSADAAKIIQGNLYADVFAGANEDPAAASPEEPADPAEVELEECVATCSVLKKPSKKKATKVKESDIATGLQGCIDVCYENDDATVKNRLEHAVPKDAALRCAQTAAGKYKEVGKKCSTMRSIRCNNSCGDCGGLIDDELKKCENKVKKCKNEYDECKKCASEARKARDSVKKVASELDKCFAGVSPSVVKTISVQEEPAADQARVDFDDCAGNCVSKKQPLKRKDIPRASESDVETGISGCLNKCYDYAANGVQAVKNKLKSAVPTTKAAACAATAAEKFKEVSNKCGKYKKKKCSSCDDTDSKCKKEYDRCEKCAKEVKKAEKSLKKVGNELDRCLFGTGTDVDSAVEIA